MSKRNSAVRRSTRSSSRVRRSRRRVANRPTWSDSANCRLRLLKRLLSVPSAMRTASAIISLRMSHSCRIGLGEIAALTRPSLERHEGGRRVDVDDRVELIGRPGAEIMARAFRLGSVDDADGPLEARDAERLA